MDYGNADYGSRTIRAMDTVQDRLERDVCACGHTRKQHANGQGIQPKFIPTGCGQCACAIFRYGFEGRYDSEQPLQSHLRNLYELRQQAGAEEWPVASEPICEDVQP